MKTKILILLMLCVPIFLGAQNYEQQGDELFAQAQYEKAIKKYNAAIEILGASSSLQTKKEKSSKCATLLKRATNAEENNQYVEAEKAYTELYAIHPLSFYQNKANALKQKADAQIREQERIKREAVLREQQQRDAEAKAEQERKAREYIPEGTKVIRKGAFSNRLDIVQIVIPNGVTSIEIEAFKGCSRLTTITIPNSVTSIGWSAFYGCTNLTSVIWNAINCSYYYFGNQVTSFTFGNQVEVIPSVLCSGMNKLTSITIPTSVTSIGKGAFSSCNGLKSVHITDIAAWCTIKIADDDANPLKYAHNLYLNNELVKGLVIPNGVTTVWDWAFHECNSLTSVTIPNSVTNIGNEAFWGCTNLTSVTCEAATPPMCHRMAFDNCSSKILFVPEANIAAYKAAGVWKDFGTIQAIKNSAGGLCFNLDEEHRTAEVTSSQGHKYAGDIVIPTTITINNITYSVIGIKSAAFYECSNLTSVKIPNSITSIGSQAFGYCSNLIHVTIGDGVTHVGSQAFYECSSLTSVTVPNSVTNIDSQAFWGCSSLTSMTVPNSVTNIGNYVFYRCRNMTLNIPQKFQGRTDFKDCKKVIYY